MNINPLVSVIIPTSNRPYFLGVALESLRQQTFQDFEVIVINDAGVCVEEIVKKPFRADKVQYIPLEKNIDRSGARNIGLKAARGHYISYLDDDDRFLPHHLECLVKILEEGGRFTYSTACRVMQKLEAGVYVDGVKDIPYCQQYDPIQILLKNYIPIVCVMHEKGLIDEVGYFDEAFRVLEDWDLWIRMSRCTDFRFTSEVTCEYTTRNDNSSTTSESANLFSKVEQVIFLRYLRYINMIPGLREAVFSYQMKYLMNLISSNSILEAESFSKELEYRHRELALVN